MVVLEQLVCYTFVIGWGGPNLVVLVLWQRHLSAKPCVCTFDTFPKGFIVGKG